MKVKKNELPITMDPAEVVEQAMLSRQQAANETIARGDSDIQLFYSNTAVFITGGSGFLGKQLIEKLFRSCKIRKMFLLIRPKKEKDVRQRLAEILKDPVFDLLRKSQPEFQDCIVTVEGDLVLPKLGISEETWRTITKEVTVIFHGAATLKFDELLQKATLAATEGYVKRLSKHNYRRLLKLPITMDPAEVVEQAMLSRQQAANETIARGDSDIQLFYSNTAVFITGGSGFLGKQLIEKLFRSCKIRKMFLLIRPKKEKDVRQRLAEILKDPVFDLLRKSQPEFQDCIVTVEGDLVLPKLGISEETWRTITKEVTVIFHGAATLKFDELLQKATFINVRGTREMLQLGHTCKQLRSFVYISTAYSHVTSSMLGEKVLEKFYPVPIDPDTMVQLAESMDAENIEKIASGLIDGWPNTYCFTKALAEELVRTKECNLPVCIVRPAIIIGAYQEPAPGWIDAGNLYGASGMLLGFIMGLIHVNFSKPKGKMDFVPVDFVNNAVIAACRETGKRWDDGKKYIKIYTVSSERKVLSPEACVRILHSEFRKFMSPKAFWYMYVFVTDNLLLYKSMCFFCHDIPAIVVDGASYLMGKQPHLKPLYKKVQKMTGVLKYFTVYEWSFSDQNLLELYRSMSRNDKIIFNFDIANVSTTDMMVAWALGLRKYVLKDGLKGTETGVMKQKIFKIVSVLVLFIYMFLIWMIVNLLYFIFKGTYLNV